MFHHDYYYNYEAYGIVWYLCLVLSSVETGNVFSSFAFVFIIGYCNIWYSTLKGHMHFLLKFIQSWVNHSTNLINVLIKRRLSMFLSKCSRFFRVTNSQLTSFILVTSEQIFQSLHTSQKSVYYEYILFIKHCVEKVPECTEGSTDDSRFSQFWVKLK